MSADDQKQDNEIAATIEGFESAETPKAPAPDDKHDRVRDALKLTGWPYGMRVSGHNKDGVIFGKVVFHRGTLDPHEPRVRWQNGFGTSHKDGEHLTVLLPKDAGYDAVIPFVEGDDGKESAPKAKQSRPEFAPGYPKGARVRLNETKWGDDDKNPVWGGSQGCTGGTIIPQIHGGANPCRVKWDNGQENSYFPENLARLSTEEQLLATDNELLPRKEQKRAPWPVDATKNREAWLSEAARRIAKNPNDDLSGVLLSVGFGKGGTRGASDWSVIENKAENGWQVFVRPNVAEKVGALACVVGALQKLGVRLLSREQLSAVGRDWPEYPQPDVTHEHKQQATRLIKCWCRSCGYTVRTTQRWLVGGAPLCPCANPPLPMLIAKAE